MKNNTASKREKRVYAFKRHHCDSIVLHLTRSHSRFLGPTGQLGAGGVRGGLGAPWYFKRV